MTDYEKTKKFLSNFGVTFDEYEYDTELTIFCKEGEHKKIIGYCGFCLYFNFNLDGSFVSIGVGE